MKLQTAVSIGIINLQMRERFLCIGFPSLKGFLQWLALDTQSGMVQLQILR
jgi:hypothetical protein